MEVNVWVWICCGRLLWVFYSCEVLVYDNSLDDQFPVLHNVWMFCHIRLNPQAEQETGISSIMSSFLEASKPELS